MKGKTNTAYCTGMANMKSLKTFQWMGIILVAAIVAGELSAQQKKINRKDEAGEFPDLQTTEDIQDQNIANVYKRLATFGHLVEMARQDRLNKFREENVDRLNFNFTHRDLKYTPHNTYVRFVHNGDKFSTVGLGETQKVMGQINEKVAVAKSIGINANEIQFPDLDGIELTKFDFLYEIIDQERRAIGSRRKSISLYFQPGDVGPDQERNFTLEMAVTRITDDNYQEGRKYVQLIIDPSPMDDNNDDIVVLHRYNQKPTVVTVLGTMRNSANYPHRIEFKQKFYVKLLDNFFRLFRLVDGYSRKDGDDFNDELLKHLERGNEY